MCDKNTERTEFYYEFFRVKEIYPWWIFIGNKKSFLFISKHFSVLIYLSIGTNNISVMNVDTNLLKHT